VFGEDAEHSKPERWIEDKDKADGMGKYLFEFGPGNHIYLGRNVTLLEIYKLVAVFLREFEVSDLSL
jgi:cytochrome P450